MKRGLFFILSVTIIVIAPLISRAQNTDISTTSTADTSISIPLSLSISDALDIMVTENYELKAANYATATKSETRKAARAHYYPTIGFIASYSILDDDVAFKYDLNSAKSAAGGMVSKYLGWLPFPVPSLIRQKINKLPSELSYTLQDQQFGIAAATLMWPIYTGGLITAANRAAKAKEAIAHEKYNQIEDEKISELIERYYGLQMAKQLFTLREEVVIGISEHVSDAQKMEENGMLSHAEVLYAESSLTQAEAKMIGAKYDISVVSSALQVTLNTTQDLSPKSSFFITTVLPPVEDLVAYAQVYNPQIAQLESTLTLTDQAVKKEVAEYIPDLALMGYGEVANYQVTDMVPNWYIGLTLKFDIFSGFGRYHRIKAAKLQREEVEMIKLGALQKIELAIKKAYAEVEKAKATYFAGEKTIQFAEEYYRVQQRSFAEGMSSSHDLIDASLNLQKCKIERLNAAYNYNIALAQLLQYSGQSSDYIHYQQTAIKIVL